VTSEPAIKIRKLDIDVAFNDFVRHTFIAKSAHDARLPTFNVIRVNFKYSDLLNNTIMSLVRQRKSHILALGYQVREAQKVHGFSLTH
jgi:hypothetical protein